MDESAVAIKRAAVGSQADAAVRAHCEEYDSLEAEQISLDGF